MASLYKKPVVVNDPKTGKKINAKSKKWWGRYRDENGVERRVPLATDKTAAQAMLGERVKKVELKTAGLVDPFENHRKRPLKEHAGAFECFLRHKGNCDKHISGTSKRVLAIVDGCKWVLINDMSPGCVQRFLADLRTGEEALSVQTSNHYLRAIKQFSRWLVRDRRTSDDPLAHLSMLNHQVDRRRERRALSAAEFAELIEAAEGGPRIESIPGRDRAMMYVLAAWTGYRKTEIGSLTLRSLRLDEDPPSATVAAAYSKRRREDTQVLHPDVASRLRDWLARKTDFQPDDLLFPVSDKVPGGVDRKTSKMMRLDLDAARRKWIGEGDCEEEKEARERSDFLCYCDGNGHFADFHSNRHTFITNLSRAGVSPKTAQVLARHSDIRLTMGVYTHISLDDRMTAIASLPAPPCDESSPQETASVLRATGTENDHPSQQKVPTVVPSGAKNGAKRLASTGLRIAPDCTDGGPERKKVSRRTVCKNPETTGRIRAIPDRPASRRIEDVDAKNKLRPAGIEPATCGLEVRCSIQLSYGRW
jgi:site-specific recombinase XerD